MTYRTHLQKAPASGDQAGLAGDEAELVLADTS